MIELQGRVAFVTGGDRGIGWAVSELLARAGAAVAVGFHRNEDAAREAAQSIRDEGGMAETVQGDVRRDEDVARMVREIIAAFGRIDILVNNAGIWTEGAFVDLAPDTISDTFAVNVLGPIHCIRHASRDMMSRGWGRIISIGSTAAARGEPRHSHYAASKGALLALTRSLAREFGGGITVNMVSPGWIYTDMTAAVLTPERIVEIEREIPGGRIGRATDVAGAVLFLASDLAAHVNGADLVVDGGARGL